MLVQGDVIPLTWANDPDAIPSISKPELAPIKALLLEQAKLELGEVAEITKEVGKKAAVCLAK